MRLLCVVLALFALSFAHEIGHGHRHGGHPPIPPRPHPPSCKREADCQAFSTSPLYVQCSSGTCSCLNSQGFSGNATAGNKCHCAAGNSVIVSGGTFYCLNVPAAVQAVEEQNNCEINKEVIKALYQTLIWYNDTDNPLPWIYAAIGLPSDKDIYTVFDPAGKIRVVPFGVFPTPVNSILYYLVFAITGTQVANVTFPYLYCEGDSTYVRADIGFGFDGVVYENITEVGTYTMTDENRIISADAYAISIGTVTAPSVADPQLFIEGVCADLTINPGLFANTTQQQGSCSEYFDPDGFYANFSDCVSFMNSIDFGTYWNADQGSVVCRAIHTSMAFWDPAEHCPHAGKTGGGVCVPTAYQVFYEQNFKKRGVRQSGGTPSFVNQYFSELVAHNPPASWEVSTTTSN